MTSYSGLWNNEYGENHSLLSNTTGNALSVFAKNFAKRIYGRAVIRELTETLVAGAIGATAATSHKRIKGIADVTGNVLGGAREIETFIGINRATTQADADKIVGAFEQSAKPTYPVDRSGNGGGNKLGW